MTVSFPFGAASNASISFTLPPASLLDTYTQAAGDVATVALLSPSRFVLSRVVWADAADAHSVTPRQA